jgi:hypothetical protein
MAGALEDLALAKEYQDTALPTGLTCHQNLETHSTLYKALIVCGSGKQKGLVDTFWELLWRRYPPTSFCLVRQEINVSSKGKAVRYHRLEYRPNRPIDSVHLIAQILVNDGE